MGAAARWLPVLLLLVVAAHQNVRARTSDLAAWHGGGFGMFSTTDVGSRRHLHVFVVRPGLEREIAVPELLADHADRALAWPSEPRLEAFAREIAGALGAAAGNGETVLIQVFRTRYDPETLAPSGELLRTVEVPIGE